MGFYIGVGVGVRKRSELDVEDGTMFVSRSHAVGPWCPRGRIGFELEGRVDGFERTDSVGVEGSDSGRVGEFG